MPCDGNKQNQPTSSSFLSNPFAHAVHSSHPSTRIARQNAGATTDDRSNQVQVTLPQLKQPGMDVKLSTPNHSSPIYPAPGQAASSPHATLSVLRPYRAAPATATARICIAHLLASAPTEWLHEIPVHAPIRPFLLSFAHSQVFFI